jgi:hypothetical protein
MYATMGNQLNHEARVKGLDRAAEQRRERLERVGADEARSPRHQPWLSRVVDAVAHPFRHGGSATFGRHAAA